MLLLTLIVWVYMYVRRISFITGKNISPKDLAAPGELARLSPPAVSNPADNLKNLFEIPVLFYVLIALALPLRHADLFIVLMSWVFVVTRFAHAGIFVTSNNVRQRGQAWFAGVLVLLAMWIYFALKILLLI